MNTALAPRPLHPKKWRKIPRWMMTGTDSRRQFFANVKYSLNSRAAATRRRVAQESDAGELNVAREKGFAMYPPTTFPETQTLVDFANERIKSRNAQAIPTRKAQLKQGFIDMKTLTLDSPHMQFALRPDVLAAVSKYLGIVPILADVDVWFSTYPGDAQQEYSNSQLWHCDAIDTTQIKIFLYSNAVEDDSGPLVVMGAQTSQKLRDDLHYTFTPDRIRVSDEEVSTHVGDGDQHPIVGPGGTWAFVDTARCFHYGSRVLQDAPPRIVTVFEYYTPAAFVFPIDYRKIAPMKHLSTPDLLPIQRLALGAE